MKLEYQCCSLELAKRLKELGIKQGESLFVYWTDCTLPFEEIYENRRWEFLLSYKEQSLDNGCRLRNTIDAFTVAELGEMLPNKDKFQWWSYQVSGLTSWCCRKISFPYKKAEDWNRVDFSGKSFSGKTEADVRAKMLIHLIEKGIVKP